MSKRNFIFLIVMAGCSTSNEIEKKELISSMKEPKGLNCANGGIKIISGTDLNGNTTLEAEEITAYKFVCLPDLPPGYDGIKISSGQLTSLAGGYYSLNCPNGGIDILFDLDPTDNEYGSYAYKTLFKYSFCSDRDGIYEMARSIKLPEVYFGLDTTINQAIQLRDFNISDFKDFDRVDYSMYTNTDNFEEGIVGWAQLFNVTDNLLIEGSQLAIDGFGGDTRSKSNFINNFPDKKIILGIKSAKRKDVISITANSDFLVFWKSSLR